METNEGEVGSLDLDTEMEAEFLASIAIIMEPLLAGFPTRTEVVEELALVQEEETMRTGMMTTAAVVEIISTITSLGTSHRQKKRKIPKTRVLTWTKMKETQRRTKHPERHTPGNHPVSIKMVTSLARAQLPVPIMCPINTITCLLQNPTLTRTMFLWQCHILLL